MDVSYTLPCGVSKCVGFYEVDRVPIQPNPCAFFQECFCHPMGVDDNAAFIYNGVLHGFEIVDNGFAGSYSSTILFWILSLDIKCIVL